MTLRCIMKERIQDTNQAGSATGKGAAAAAECARSCAQFCTVCVWRLRNASLLPWADGSELAASATEPHKHLQTASPHAHHAARMGVKSQARKRQG